MPCFAVANLYGGEQNGLNQIYYFRISNSEIILVQHLNLRGEMLNRFSDFPAANGSAVLLYFAAEAAKFLRRAL